MEKLLAVLVLAGASVNAQTITQTFGSGANAFSIDFVTIGNPNNPANNLVNYNGRAGLQIEGPVGSVGYSYAISKYEINRSAVTKVNAEGITDLGSLEDMSAYSGFGLPGRPASEMNGANRPATGLTWYGAARFVNWLNTSQGYAPAYKLSLNPPSYVNQIYDSVGLWTPSESGYNPQNLIRNTNAKFFLPSLDEWHKAAYFNPVSSSYSIYATGSNDFPTITTGGTEQGTAVYGTSIQGYDGIDADVDNAGGLSAYGTMGQTGNVSEWVETAKDLVNDSTSEQRLFVGGAFRNYAGIRADELNEMDAYGSNAKLGFRIAMVPEPSSLSLLLAGGAVLMAGRRRKVTY